MPNDLTTTKTFIDILQSIITIAAIIFGGISSYYLFIRKREDLPKIMSEHTVSFTDLGNGESLLTLMVTLQNTGERLVILDQGWASIQQVLPMNDETARMLRKNTIKDGRTFEGETAPLTWPSIGYQPKVWEKGHLEVEPGEDHQVDFVFPISNKVRRVRVYTWFRNGAKQKKGLGWPKISFVDVQQ